MKCDKCGYEWKSPTGITGGDTYCHCSKGPMGIQGIDGLQGKKSCTPHWKHKKKAKKKAKRKP